MRTGDRNADLCVGNNQRPTALRRATVLLIAALCAAGLTVRPAEANLPPWVSNSLGLSSNDAYQLYVAARALGMTNGQARAVLKDRAAAERIPITTEAGQDPTYSAVQWTGPQRACRTITHWTKSYNRWGSRLWTFYQDRYWCWDGYKVTYAPEAGYWADVRQAYGWTYHGIVGKADVLQGPVGGGHWIIHSWGQGRFEGCIFHYGCFENRYPRLATWGYGNGVYALG